MNTDELRGWLSERLSQMLGMADGAIDVRERFSRYGLDSMATTCLVAELSTKLGRPLPPTLAWEYPTIEAVVRHLTGGGEGSSPEPFAPGRAPGVNDEPIAVVGMACRFPQAPDLATFWRLLCEGTDAITPVPEGRWDAGALFDEDPSAPGKLSTRWGGFLDQVDQFDPQFFGISPREAVQMDPQQRLVLELAWEALEDAGIPPRSLMDSRTGVFVGAMWQDYAAIPADPLRAITQHTATGRDLSIIAARVSYSLGLRGPSVALNTASSASLVAIHYARQSLRLGECELALAGGVNLLLSPESTVAMSKFGAMAPDGRAKAFDSRANGYVRGEGGGVVVLKSLSRALADGDPIYCLLLGSSVNNDGFSNGLTAPSPKAQELMLRDAYADAGVDPREVQFIEAHGTGTMLGDPIEAAAIGAVLGAGRPADRPILLGAVKTNIGHLEAAAGVGGFIKTALALKHRLVPPNLHFREPNPHIPFDALRLKVPTAVEPWPAPEGRALAGVSSFGFGGTNCHVVLQGVQGVARDPAALGLPALPDRRPADEAMATLLPLSAHVPEARRELARRMAGFLRQPGGAPLSDILYTASVRRSHLAHRLAVVGRSRDELAEALNAYARGEAPPGIEQGKASSEAPKVVFVFPGQGSQWAGMGQALLAGEPVFGEALRACDAALSPHTGFSILDELRRPEKSSRLAETQVAQPSLFAIEVALSALLRSWGVEPAAVIGHSVGEIAAAHVAGILDLEQAARVVAVRAKLMQRATGQGKMVSVALGEQEAQKLIEGVADRASIAAINEPGQVVLSGETAVIDALLERLSAQGVESRPLRVNYAFHSPQMDPLRAELVEALGAVGPKAGSIPLISTVRGAEVPGEALDSAYWGDNVRQPVRLSEAIHVVASRGPTLLVEVGPHPVLSHHIEHTLSAWGREGRAVPTLRRHKDEQEQLLSTLGKLYVGGCKVAFGRLYPEGGRVVALPAYPWQRERFWIEAGTPVRSAGRGARRAGKGGAEHPLLGAPLSSFAHPDERMWEQGLSVAALPYLAEHRVQGEIIFPGAGYVEMALAAGAAALGSAELLLEEVAFEQMLALADTGERLAQLVLTEQGAGRGAFQIASRAGDATGWTRHASGTVGRRVGEAGPERTPETLAALKLRLGTRLGAAEHYARLRARQMDYGPAFQGVVELWVGEGEALGRVELPEPVNDQGYTLHPALLDACLQVAAALSPDEAATYVPSGIKSLRLRARTPRRAWVVAARRASEETKRGEVRCDLRIVDDEERLLLEIEALCARRVEARAQEPRGSELRASLAGISRDEALVLLEQFFAREAGHVLRLPPSRIERSTPFGRLGMDSLMMMELKNRVLAGAGVELSNATLTRYDHVGALASYLLEQLSLEHLLSEVSASAEEATAGEEMESVTL